MALEEDVDAAVALAKSAVRLKYEDIPYDTVQATKIDILDTLGTAVAGSSAPGTKELVQLVQEWAGKEESTILAYGNKVPAPMAALCNGAMAHALDYDDTHDAAVLHAGVSTVPASFAIAECVGKVTGKEIITAVTLGIDIVCRMGIATTKGLRGWLLTAVYGFFAAAMAAGKLLRLDEDAMINALGLAYSQAAGNNECVASGALSKRMQAGFAAKGGVLSALMAEMGITGARDSLEGRAGLFQVYQRGEYYPTPLTAGLGKSFESPNLSFKPWPCCRDTHTYITATLELVHEHDIHLEDIEHITVFVGKDPPLLCHPLDIKRKPRNIVDAQFSIPYTVATAIVKRNIVMEDFTAEGIKDTTILNIAKKVTPMFDPSLAARGISPAIIEIELTDGRTIRSRRVEYACGHPRNPMSREALIQKFRDCVTWSAKPLPQENIEGVIDMVNNLEHVDDMGQIMQLLAP